MRKSEPAFPVYNAENPLADTNRLGLTKREWFAGMALQALIAQLSNTKQAEDMMTRLGFGEGQFDRLVSKCAYDYADAMLAEGKKP